MIILAFACNISSTYFLTSGSFVGAGAGIGLSFSTIGSSHIVSLIFIVSGFNEINESIIDSLNRVYPSGILSFTDLLPVLYAITNNPINIMINRVFFNVFIITSSLAQLSIGHLCG